MAARVACFFEFTSAASVSVRCPLDQQTNAVSPGEQDMKSKTPSVTIIFIFTLLSVGLAIPVVGFEKRPVTIFPGEIELAGSVRQREKAVLAKEKELAAREELVVELELEVAAKLARLTELQKDIEEKLGEIRKTEDDHFRDLVRLYSSMKAANVAVILNAMEDDDVVRVLKAMRTDMAAQIMPRLDREKAVRISKQLGMM
jgi:outer membrane lipopolysaccharide assembly protein LptE/RlpB